MTPAHKPELIVKIQPKPKTAVELQIVVVVPGTHGALAATVADGEQDPALIIVATPKQKTATSGKAIATAAIPMPGVPGVLAQAPAMEPNIEQTNVIQRNIKPAMLAPALAQHKLQPLQ